MTDHVLLGKLRTLHPRLRRVLLVILEAMVEAQGGG